MAYSILKITDGTNTNTINLLNISRGFLLNEWRPTIAPYKGGGVWQSSPLVDGRRMAMRNFDNAIETFDMKLSAIDQDTAISYIQDLTTLLEKAVAYWTTSWQGEPVWLEARGATETNVRYAVIKGYTLEGLNNPFAQPFFRDCDVAMDNISLIIERDHWTDHIPGTQTCVNLSTYREVVDTSLVASTTDAVAEDADDIYVSYQLDYYTYNLISNTCVVGMDGVDTYFECGLRFPSVNVPLDAIITDAYIEVVIDDVVEGDDALDFIIRIYGEAEDDPPIWNVYTYLSRRNNPTDATSYFNSPAGTWHTEGETKYITGLAGVVQELVNRTGWVSGNSMCFFLRPIGELSFNKRTFAAFGNPSYSPAILHVEYATGTKNVGRAPTCTGSVFVTNKSTRTQVDYVYRYEGGSYHDVLADNILIESPPHNADKLYIGIDATSPNAGPFDNFTVNVNTATTSDVVLSYHYPTADGAPPTWAHLAGLDGNYNLLETGETAIAWTFPTSVSPWVLCTINGILGWWMMIEVDDQGLTGLGSTKVAGSDIYIANNPYVTIDGDDVPGEISALARIRLLGINDYSNIDMVSVGLRSLSRGEKFTPYLNLSRYQNPDGITVSGSIGTDITAPAQEDVQYSHSGTITAWVTLANITFDNTIATEYRGLYHAYIRGKQVGGASGDISLKLALYPSYGSTDVTWSDTGKMKTASVIHLIDLGIISFGSGENVTAQDMVSVAYISVQYFTEATDAIDITLYDIILIPIDEWAGTYLDAPDANSSLQDGYLLDLDAISAPRTQRAIFRISNSVDIPVTAEYFNGEWIRQARGGPILQANADQRLWFMFAGRNGEVWEADFQIVVSIRIYRNSRYLTMRGGI